MAKKPALAMVLQGLLQNIDFDAPSAIKVEPVLECASVQPRKPQHICDIIGDLSLDLD